MEKPIIYLPIQPRRSDELKKNLARIPLYQALDTIKIDTDSKTVLEIVNEVQKL